MDLFGRTLSFQFNLWHLVKEAKGLPYSYAMSNCWSPELWIFRSYDNNYPQVSDAPNTNASFSSRRSGASTHTFKISHWALKKKPASAIFYHCWSLLLVKSLNLQWERRQAAFGNTASSKRRLHHFWLPTQWTSCPSGRSDTLGSTSNAGIGRLIQTTDYMHNLILFKVFCVFFGIVHSVTQSTTSILLSFERKFVNGNGKWLVRM